MPVCVCVFVCVCVCLRVCARALLLAFFVTGFGLLSNKVSLNNIPLRKYALALKAILHRHVGTRYMLRVHTCDLNSENKRPFSLHMYLEAHTLPLFRVPTFLYNRS